MNKLGTPLANAFVKNRNSITANSVKRKLLIWIALLGVTPRETRQ